MLCIYVKMTVFVLRTVLVCPHKKPHEETRLQNGEGKECLACIARTHGGN